jgi:hypothetical protein
MATNSNSNSGIDMTTFNCDTMVAVALTKAEWEKVKRQRECDEKTKQFFEAYKKAEEKAGEKKAEAKRLQEEMTKKALEAQKAQEAEDEAFDAFADSHENEEELCVRVKFYAVQTSSVTYESYDDFKREFPDTKCSHKQWLRLCEKKRGEEIEIDANDQDDPYVEEQDYGEFYDPTVIRDEIEREIKQYK